MGTRVVVRVALLAAVLAVGLWRRRTDGRVRAADGILGAGDLAAPLGARATLVQFSTEFCAPCRAARRVLGEAAGSTDGVVHVEVDAFDRLDLAKRFEVRRTPTLLVLDGAGRVVRRASGVPSAADVRAALAEAGAGA